MSKVGRSNHYCRLYLDTVSHALNPHALFSPQGASAFICDAEEKGVRSIRFFQIPPTAPFYLSYFPYTVLLNSMSNYVTIYKII